ncbi:hypothetical protein [Flavobacterium urocaniciphilum]|uniref:Uncharacterized protein n=1 Tax=Flavobacterium urocaniciphilum TaxID=1299341 RepID=A0A1H9DUA0_9FLAO|nr:hypothetical protein [Flavobacterium urocaniciphilum]SEQ16971.1 hypothetical protein SAMN05444005_10870 [Flavobacterium urocaniciphilum]
MLKNILNANGAKTLTSAEQKAINGGKKLYRGTCELPEGGAPIVCPEGTVCVDTINGPECLPEFNG